MTDLERLERSAALWGLEEFTGVVNLLIPAYIPEASADARMRQELTPRLVRSYATVGLLDEPVRDGRNARYGFRHLLQVLVIRRLLTDGLSTAAIGARVANLSNAELEELLQGGVRVELSVANPAIAFLRAVQERSRSAGEGPQPVSPIGVGEPGAPHAADQPGPPAAIPQAGACSQWTGTPWMRVVVADGVELHVRDDLIGSGAESYMRALADEAARVLEGMVRPSGRAGERGGTNG